MEDIGFSVMTNIACRLLRIKTYLMIFFMKSHSYCVFFFSVSTWNNERSNLDRSLEEERRLERKRKNSDYDDEMDRGRVSSAARNTYSYDRLEV